MRKLCGAIHIIADDNFPIGYSIADAETGAELYAAGNHALDSGSVTRDPDVALSHEELCRDCEKTGYEMSNEMGAQWLGVGEAEPGAYWRPPDEQPEGPSFF